MLYFWLEASKYHEHARRLWSNKPGVQSSQSPISQRCYHEGFRLSNSLWVDRALQLKTLSSQSKTLTGTMENTAKASEKAYKRPTVPGAATRVIRFNSCSQQNHLLHWSRRRGCRGCNFTPKSFDLVKIREKCEEIRAKYVCVVF